MNTIKTGDQIMFSTPKGAVKIGIVKDIKDVLHGDEYCEVYTVELENGKTHYVDSNHVINKIA
jgi:hypothetical protein